MMTTTVPTTMMTTSRPRKWSRTFPMQQLWRSEPRERESLADFIEKRAFIVQQVVVEEQTTIERYWTFNDKAKESGCILSNTQ
jgi:hypothetical protein